MKEEINKKKLELYVQGDLNDCPEGDRFSIGTYKGRKQENGFIEILEEDLDLVTTIHKLVDHEPSEPIISRRSYKNGGRFLDGCYTNSLDKVLKMEILDMKEVCTDHKMVVHTIDSSFKKLL
jgi:hypothetical protein